MSGMHMPTLEELKATDRLPSPQGVALEVIRLTRSDSFTNAQLAHVVQADPALCARLLRAANSAALGGRRPVASVSEAILVLGIPTARQLVLSFSLVSRYRGGGCPGFDYRAFWSRSLLLGVASQNLCKNLRAAAPEEVFACGLLANIGRLALATVYPEQYGEVLREMEQDEGLNLIEQERFALGIDHVALGAAMLEDWRFPSLFVSAVSARTAPQDAGFAEGSRLLALARVFQLAESIASLCLLEEEQQRTRLPGALFDAARLGIDGEDLERMILNIRAEWREWAQVLDVPDQDVVPPMHPSVDKSAEEITKVQPVLSSAMRMRILDVGVKDPAMAALREQSLYDGHSMASVYNAKQALATMLSLRPHLILISLDLPEEEGLHLVKALRATEMASDAYIFVVARSGQDTRVLTALNCGADDVLTLPLAPAVLIARLRAAQRSLGQQVVLTRSLEEIRKFSRELALNNRRLQQRLHIDELTGLPNMHYCRQRLDQAWAAARRRRGELAVLLIDLDHFKQVNERYGHAVGDEVLCKTGMLLRGTARLQDVVCRTGGSEYTLICPDTGAMDALRCAERLRQGIEEKSADMERRLPAVTVSVGAAVNVKNIEEAEDLLRHAGRSLYQAKSLGRNRACLWEGQ